MVGHFLGAEPGGVDHHDALVRRRLVVYVVESVAADEYRLHAFGFLNDLAGELDAGVYDDVRAGHRLYRLAVAGARELLDLVVHPLDLLLDELGVRLAPAGYYGYFHRHSV